MDADTYKATFADEDSPGWRAIDAAMAKLYGPGEPLGHFAPSVPPMLGGRGPDGISVYQADGHLHYVTYGFTTLHYDEEAAGGEFSGAGFELTFRLKGSAETPDAVPQWPIVVMQNLFAYVRESGRWFEPGHGSPSTGGPLDTPTNPETTSQITGIVFAEDPELGTIDTPHGKVQFLQMAGLTRAECEAVVAGETSFDALVEKLSKLDPKMVTDLSRT